MGRIELWREWVEQEASCSQQPAVTSCSVQSVGVTRAPSQRCVHTSSRTRLWALRLGWADTPGLTLEQSLRQGRRQGDWVKPSTNLRRSKIS